MSNKRFTPKQLLDMANNYAQMYSGCKKVSVGSVITSEDGTILSFGANAAIPDICKTTECMRIQKYGDNAKSHRLPSDCRAIHSEVDAICHLTCSANGGRIYITRYPCEACARAIVAAGIRTVFFGRKQVPTRETEDIFLYHGVACIQVNWDAEDSYV